MATQPVAVILDFDGVVVDSLGIHLAAWAEAVAEVFAQPLPPPEEIIGRATRTIAHVLCNRYGDPGRVAALIAAKDAAVRRRLGTVTLLPGARELIAAMAAMGLPHGIASNARRNFLDATLAAAGLILPVVLSSDDVARPKPEPDIFWECANRLGISHHDRQRVIVFEDSAHGLRAAVAAGMVPIGVTTEAPAAKLLAAGARVTCAHLGEALTRGYLSRLPS